MKIREKKCKECSTKFVPFRTTQPCCSSRECMESFALKVVAKAKVKREKAEKALHRAKKESIKTKGELTKEAQKAINAFRRNEELMKGRGCISCGKSQEELIQKDGWKPGGVFDAGHFIGVGANCSLRFEPRNIWLQCKSCNAGSGKYARKAATVAQNYEANLREQEGDGLVDWLKGPHPMNNYKIDDLREIRDFYRAKLKELKSNL